MSNPPGPTDTHPDLPDAATWGEPRRRIASRAVSHPHAAMRTANALIPDTQYDWMDFHSVPDLSHEW
jgi:hypothetical protein